MINAFICINLHIHHQPHHPQRPLLWPRWFPPNWLRNPCPRSSLEHGSNPSSFWSQTQNPRFVKETPFRHFRPPRKKSCSNCQTNSMYSFFAGIEEAQESPWYKRYAVLKRPGCHHRRGLSGGSSSFSKFLCLSLAYQFTSSLRQFYATHPYTTHEDCLVVTGSIVLYKVLLYWPWTRNRVFSF